MIRNQRMHANTTVVGGISRIAKSNPFVLAGIKALFAASKNSTTAAEILTPESCTKQKCSPDNAGLMLETFNSASLYVASGQALDDETTNQLLVTLAAELTDAEVLFRRGNLNDPKTFDFGMSVQFNETHRLRIVRSSSNVYEKDSVVETTNPITGEVSTKVEKVIRNPYGWKVSFIPNEYVSGYVTAGATFSEELTLA